MPYIKITEEEAAQFTTFDVTENTVLIPMLYARSFIESYDSEGKLIARTYTETTEDCEAKLFQNAKKFKDAFSSGATITKTMEGFDSEGNPETIITDFGYLSRFVNLAEDEYDRSYVMAYELLQQGLNVVIKPIIFDNASFYYEKINGSVKARKTLVDEVDAQTIIDWAICKDDCLDEFRDRNLFNIKFVTCGAYANLGKVVKYKLIEEACKSADELVYEKDAEGNKIEDDAESGIHTKLANICATDDTNGGYSGRGDAFALLDLRENILNKKELIDELKDKTPDAQDRYAAAFFPWCTFNTSAYVSAEQVSMPASFAYLMAYANSVKNNANWFAPGGVTRGFVPNMIKPNFNVGEALMHFLQGDDDWHSESTKIACRVNPIYNAGSYGYRIWGNRVYKAKDSVALKDQYLEFLNVRVLLCDIKKQIFHAAMRTTFEPNDDIVWINFKSLCNSLLDSMKAGRGLVWYKWTKEKVEEKALIKATLTIKPIEAVESFDVNVVLTDEEATVTEA